MASVTAPIIGTLRALPVPNAADLFPLPAHIKPHTIDWLKWLILNDTTPKGWADLRMRFALFHTLEKEALLNHHCACCRNTIDRISALQLGWFNICDNDWWCPACVQRTDSDTEDNEAHSALEEDPQ